LRSFEFSPTIPNDEATTRSPYAPRTLQCIRTDCFFALTTLDAFNGTKIWLRRLRADPNSGVIPAKEIPYVKDASFVCLGPRRDGKDWLVLNRTKDELKAAPAFDKKAEEKM
jgi:hypothetical protein